MHLSRSTHIGPIDRFGAAHRTELVPWLLWGGRSSESIDWINSIDLGGWESRSISIGHRVSTLRPPLPAGCDSILHHMHLNIIHRSIHIHAHAS